MGNGIEFQNMNTHFIKEHGGDKSVFENFHKKVSLVFPSYNERKRLPNLLNALKEFDEFWQIPYDIIIVDDGSKDGSPELVRKLFEDAFSENASFRLIVLPQNKGKGGALKAGVEQATGDYILTIDADAATRPLQLVEWISELPENQPKDNEILIGSGNMKILNCRHFYIEEWLV